MVLYVSGRPPCCRVGVSSVLGLGSGEKSGSMEAAEVEGVVVDDEEERTECSVNMNCRGNKNERMIPM